MIGLLILIIFLFLVPFSSYLWNFTTQALQLGHAKMELVGGIPFSVLDF